MRSKRNKPEQVANPAPRGPQGLEPPELDIETHISFAEMCNAITGLDGQDQFLWIALAGMEQTELEGHVAEAPRTFLSVRGMLSVSHPDAWPFRDGDLAFVLTGSQQYPLRFSIGESFITDAFWDPESRLVLEMDGGVRLTLEGYRSMRVLD